MLPSLVFVRITVLTPKKGYFKEKKWGFVGEKQELLYKVQI